ncbi:hypothetical protein ECAA86_00115 [Escherichia coli AA86]|nr:hypothetical protein ECAA86_00115 [Escherichia coli AA86]BDH27455.1 hypothetical protein TRECRb23_08910 [Escherichia coli]
MGIGYPISCASARFLTAKGLFRYTALDGNGCNMAGSFAEDLVKCLQNGLNFSGIGGRTDNLVHNQHYSEN